MYYYELPSPESRLARLTSPQAQTESAERNFFLRIFHGRAEHLTLLWRTTASNQQKMTRGNEAKTRRKREVGGQAKIYQKKAGTGRSHGHSLYGQWGDVTRRRHAPARLLARLPFPARFNVHVDWLEMARGAGGYEMKKILMSS